MINTTPITMIHVVGSVDENRSTLEDAEDIAPIAKQCHPISPIFTSSSNSYLSTLTKLRDGSLKVIMTVRKVAPSKSAVVQLFDEKVNSWIVCLCRHSSSAASASISSKRIAMSSLMEVDEDNDDGIELNASGEEEQPEPQEETSSMAPPHPKRRKTDPNDQTPSRASLHKKSKSKKRKHSEEEHDHDAAVSDDDESPHLEHSPSKKTNKKSKKAATESVGDAAAAGGSMPPTLQPNHPSNAESEALAALVHQVEVSSAKTEQQMTLSAEKGRLFDSVSRWMHKVDEESHSAPEAAAVARLAALRNCFRILTLGTFQNVASSDQLIVLLADQLRLVAVSHLGYVIELLLHNIESSDTFQPLLLDLIPRLLESLRVRGASAQLWIVPQDGVGAMRSVYASAYHSEIINRLTALDWSARVYAGGSSAAPGESSSVEDRDSRDSSPLALHLGRCFKDLPMSKDEFATVTKSCIKALKGLAAVLEWECRLACGPSTR
eukprot:TRINITY_DN955_c0_g1_i5.p1 TRINITY_DN955_c0_g1~~TRINITY_DN955_c0_g1_i5.p1  ORF type:complete len:493 (+),score=94.57 TRINITY_DN955_c0_g1_i5:1379-2857(+)